MARSVEVSVVLGTYNRLDFLRGTIKSIRKDLKDLSAEIIVVDGGSNDGTLKWLVKQKDIIAVIQHNHGTWLGKELERKSWGYFMNLGFKAASGKYICMLSDDCLIVPGAIKNGIDKFKNGVGAVAFYWRDWPEKEKYHVAGTLGNKIMVNHGLFLKEGLEKINYIDEGNFEFYHADADLCLRLWDAGYQVITSPNSFIEHFSHANAVVKKANTESIKRDWNSLLARWDKYHLNRFFNRLGTTLEKGFKDPSKTHKNFPPI